MTVSLCNELVKSHQVTLLTLRPGPLTTLLAPGVSLTTLESNCLFTFALRCICYCRRHGVDVIFSNIWPLTVYVQLFKVLTLGKFEHFPIEHSPHSVEVERCRLWWRYILLALSRIVYKRVEKAFVVASSISIGMRKLGFLPGKLIEIDVPISIANLETFRDPKHIDRPRLLTVARNKPEKNLILGLRMLRRLKFHGLEFEWTVVGTAVTQLARLLHSDFPELLEQVFLVEETLETDAFYRQSDYFLSTSLTEGKPLAVIEALSYGLGVVSTPSTPALLDLLAFPGTGCISVDFTDTALCNSLVELIRKDSLDLKLERRLIASHYAVGNVTADLLRNIG